MLIATYLLSAFVQGRIIIDLQLLLFLALLLLALRTSRIHGRMAWLAAGVALAGSAAAFGAALTHTEVGEGVAAIVVARPDAHLDEKAVQAALDGRLARFKLPKRVIFVDDLPRNTMGKVQKKLLRDAYKDIYAG